MTNLKRKWAIYWRDVHTRFVHLFIDFGTVVINDFNVTGLTDGYLGAIFTVKNRIGRLLENRNFLGLIRFA